MVKPVTKAEINSFVKGLISESSPLNFPPDASKDEENFELNRDGSRFRRYGMDLEENFVVRSTGYSTSAISSTASSSFRWLGAGNNPDEELLVIQFGTHLDFYNIEENTSTSGGYVGSVTLTGAASTTKASYAAVDGKLIVAINTEVIHIIEWNGSVLSYSTSSLLVRDLWGLPGLDNNDISTRPTSLTNAHLYNLRNQGWGIPRKNAAGTLTDPIAQFFTDLAKYPANSETVYSGLQFQAGATPFERIYTNLYDEVLGLNDKAAKGYFIIDALKRGSSRATQEAANRTRYPSLTNSVSGFKTDTTLGGASLVVEHAGRVFFAGFKGEVSDPETNSPNLSNYILFSQIVKSKDEVVKCFQSGDPTSREGSDIVDTDGGFIRIAGAKKIIALRVLTDNLFVICDNGVWKVSGGSEYGFSATNYKVDKISAFGGFSEKTVVEVSDKLYFWGDVGIFLVARNQFGDWQCTSVTEAAIQTIFDDITITERRNAVGVYDAGGKKVRWLYGADADVTNTEEVKELVLDLVLGSFSKNRIYNLYSNSPRVIGYLITPSSSGFSAAEEIVVSSNPVVAGGNPVISHSSISLPQTTTVKFITIFSTVSGNSGYTFSHYKNERFREWSTVNGVGVDAKAYILTGAATAGDSSVYKQSPYLVMHFLKTEDGVEQVSGEWVPKGQSSCLVRSQWNWADSIESGNWGNTFQAYRYRRPLFVTSYSDDYDNGFEIVTSKNKLRGRGRALALYLETEPDKNCIILGWNLSLTGNSLS